MKTKHEIIDETVAAYTLDTRAVQTNGLNNPACMYLTDDGKMCAVGRCLIDPKIFKEKLGPVHFVWGSGGLNQALKPEYRGHTLKFWTAIQRLHDDGANWDSAGLNIHGKNRVRELKQRFA